MKKTLFMLVMLILICSMLTGCMALICDVTINSDSSIEVSAQTGFSEVAMTMISALEDESETNDMADMTQFKYNGNTYYGEVVNEKYNDLNEFNEFMSRFNQSGVDSGMFEILNNSDGTYTLTLTITSETANTEEMETNMVINGIEESQINELMKDMVMIFTFKMPGNITQTAGSKEGITISGNKLTIDLLKMAIPQDEGAISVYTFVSSPSNSQSGNTTSTQKFVDVPQSLWSYNAINKLADGGLVAGVGEGRFSPERGMKISEFCQVLVNATGLESGADETGYWAAKAIKSCIDNGYIYTHGEINMKNYDEIITREEAIAAMQIASGRNSIDGNNIQLSDIPDGSQISDRYKELIVQAYNSGITTGVNDQLKFSPKNQLTRGQVCQLFYNVEWTTKLQ